MRRRFIYFAAVVLLMGGCQEFRDAESDRLKAEQEALEKKQRQEREWFENANTSHPSPLLGGEEREAGKGDGSVELPTWDDAAAPRAADRTFDGAFDMTKLPNFDGAEPLQTDFNFKNAAMVDVVPVFASLLGFNFVVEGALPGTVTMSMRERLLPRQIWEILFQLFRASGVAAEYSGGILHLRNVGQIPQELTLDAPGSGIEMGIFRLRHIKCAEALAQIRKFLPRDIRAIELPASNTLLILEKSDTLNRLRMLLEELDRPAGVNVFKRVYPCSHVTAAQLAKELRSILPILGFPVSDNPADSAQNSGALVVLPLDRLDAVLVSAASEEALQEVGSWIDTLDREENGKEELFIYDVINSRAEVLVKALSAMYTVTGGMITTDAAGEIVETSNIGTPATMAKNSDVAPGSVFDVPVRIWADALHQRLTIRTTPRVYASIKAYLERIDTIPPQLLLQVLVLEVMLNDSLEFGMEFSAQIKSGNLESIFGTDYKYLTPGSGQGQQYGSKYWIFNPDNPNEKFGYVNALSGQSNVRVISSPQLLIVNNAKASINVGDDVPVITAEVTNTDSASQTGTTLVRNVTYKETGITLTVLPQITRGGRITMKVEQEVSEAQSNTTSNIDSPQVQQRKVSTTMSLRNGQLLVCGGLIREKLTESLDSLPIISSIPFLRRLLGDTQMSTVRTEMLVLITGTIVTEETKLEEMIKGYQEAVDGLVEFNQPDPDRRKRFRHKGDLERWFLE